MRREGYEKPYETLKALTRTNSVVDAQSISEFIDTLKVSDAVKSELKAITPHSYTGYWPGKRLPASRDYIIVGNLYLFLMK